MYRLPVHFIPNYVFDPHGFVTDEHGGNRESIRRQLKPDAVNRASSCEMHFYSCARRQESADWSNKAKTEFRKLVHAIYSAATPGSYQAARRALHTWTEKKAKRGHVKKWFEGFWHPRRFHAFRVFTSSTTANTNMAEVAHARNAVRGARNDTLSRAAEDHVVECALLKGKLEQYEQGNYVGGKCPNQKQKNETSLRKQVDRAGIFAKEFARGIDLESYRAEVLVDKNSSHRAKATTAPVSMMADPLEMQSSGDEDKLQPSKQMKPKYRKRTTRSKQFEQSLKLAKRARLTLDGVHDVSETQKVFELNDNGNIRFVEIGEAPACNCTFGQGKDVCFHMIWVMLNVLNVNEKDEILFQKILTSGMVKTLFKNLAENVSQERASPESSVNSVSGTSSVSVMMSGGSLHDLQSRDREKSTRPTATTHSSMTSASGNCSSTDIHVSSGSFLHKLLSFGRYNSTGPSTPSGFMDSVSENSSSSVMSFLHELESVSSVSDAIPSASNCSVTSNSGNSSNTVMSSNSFLHELQSFGGDMHARPPAVHSSMNSVAGNGSTTFGGAYARPPAAYSPVFTRPPWHNSNPFVVVNLNNKIKKCAGCPFPFRDEQGPVYLGVAVKHVEKDVYFDKASGTQRVTKEGNRYYHCQVSCITSRHPYFSPAMLRADPDLLLDDFQRYSLNSVFAVSF